MRRLPAVLLSLLLAAPSGGAPRVARPSLPAASSPAVRAGPALVVLAAPPPALSAPAPSPASLGPSLGAAPVLAAPADAPQAPGADGQAAPSAQDQLSALAAVPESDRLWTGAADAKEAKAQLSRAHRQTFKFFMGSRVELLRAMIREQEARTRGRDRAVKDLEGMWLSWRTKGYSGRVQTTGFEVADRDTVRREALRVWDRYFPKDAAAKAAFLRYMARVEAYVPAARPSNFRKLAFGVFYLTPTAPPAELPARIDAMLAEPHLKAIAEHRAGRQQAVVASFERAALASIRETNRSLPQGKRVVAVAMLGSYAIGQSTPDSDIDYQLITQDGSSDAIEPFKKALDAHWTGDGRLDKIEAFQFALPPSPEVVRASFSEGYRVISPDPRAVAALSTDSFSPEPPTAWSRSRGKLFEWGYRAWIKLRFRLADSREAGARRFAAFVAGLAAEFRDEPSDGPRRRFAAAARRSPARLEGVLGTARVATVFNGDAGRGEWQRAIRGAAWLAPSAEIVGLDLPRPLHQKTTRVDPARDWDGITVLTDVRDARYPREGRVDLVHAGFLFMEGDWKERVARYKSLVREGGFMVLSHTDRYARHEDARGTEAVLAEQFPESEGWRLVAAYYGRPPVDYPTTEWWDISVRDGHENFLLVYRKQSPRRQ